MIHNRIFSLSLVALAGAIALAATLPPAQPQDPEQPTEHHARVLKGVGEWEGTLTWFMPGAEPVTCAATEVGRAVGGFWLQTRFDCEMTGMGPYTGSGHVGYDPKTKQYVGSWVDSMSSYFARMEGEFDEKKNALVMHWDAPNMEGKMEAHCYELAHNGDSYTSTFFTGKDKQTKSMVIAMKRKNSATVDASAEKNEKK